jgi:hypothetical protein
MALTQRLQHSASDVIAGGGSPYAKRPSYRVVLACDSLKRQLARMTRMGANSSNAKGEAPACIPDRRIYPASTWQTEQVWNPKDVERALSFFKITRLVVITLKPSEAGDPSQTLAPASTSRSSRGHEAHSISGGFPQRANGACQVGMARLRRHRRRAPSVRRRNLRGELKLRDGWISPKRSSTAPATFIAGGGSSATP